MTLDRQRDWMFLTSDNTHLSEVKNRPAAQTFAHMCNGSVTSQHDRVAELLRKSTAENTRRAYKADLKHFSEWGGSIPCSPETLAAYLADHSKTLAVATLGRRLASISKAHSSLGLQSPTSSALVKSTYKGAKRSQGASQRRMKPLLVEDLHLILSRLSDDPKALRDASLLLLGFAGALRRSEIIALDLKDIEWVPEGAVLNVRRSKSDQEGRGRRIGIAYARGRHCPVNATRLWIESLAIADGPVFRRVTRHGQISEARLSPEAVARIIKAHVSGIGLDPEQYSGHSLRAGLATSAAKAGVSSWKIRQQTGHASDAMLDRYIRDGELFIGNAVAALL